MMTSFSVNTVVATVMTVCALSTISSPQINNNAYKPSVYVYDYSDNTNTNQLSTNAIINQAQREATVDVGKCINLGKLDAISQYERNWNGYNADVFSSEKIDFYKSIIEGLNKQPDIVPTAANTLVLQYYSEDGSILFYNVSMDKTERVYLPKGDIRKAEERIYTRENNMIDIINKDMETVYGS